MAKADYQILAFNRGLISKLALARVDLKRTALSAEVMRNWMPRALGSMMLRPGMAYLGATAANAAARCIPFIKKRTDTAVMEFTTAALRVWVNDALITRVSVASAVTNGTFDTDIVGWTDDDEVGGVSAWVAGGYMGLTGNGSAAAIRDQSVTVSGADINAEHALRIVIQRGPVTLRVGTSLGADDYISEATLDTGTHSLAFTPTGNFFIRFLSRLARIVLVNSCTIEAAGIMSVTSPYTASDLDNIRGGPDSQSADVVYVGCDGFQQRRIERRGNARSWAIVLYQPPDGPFRASNGGPISITPSGLTGNITLTASAALFKSTQVGALFRLISTGQTVTKNMTLLNDVSSSIRVTGVGTDRAFTIVESGFTGGGRTIVLQRSFDNSVWTAVSGKSWTADTTESYNDALDNQIVYYRLIMTVVGAAGTTAVSLTISTGSITGVARITDFTSNVSVGAEVLSDMGATTATTDWAESEWSDYRGWPTSVAFFEGRLGWAGLDKVWMTITDEFDGFDDATVGDSGPISRSIGSGPVDIINWMLPLQRIILGGQGAEFSVRSSAFDDPLTPTNFTIKPASTQGSAPVSPVRIDSRGMFVQAGGTRVFELAYGGDNSYDYSSTDLTLLIPEIGGAIDTTVHIVRMAVQRQPDTRVHCVRSDGTAAVLVYDKAENVLCWLEVTSTGASGLIEDVCVLPAQSGQREDQVYYVVARTVNGATVRYREKWALESECLGSTLNKQADAFIQFTNSPASPTVNGLTHLVGATVICWADGVCPEDTNGDIKTYVVSAGGTITLDTAATSGIVGLAYEASWQGAKLGQALSHRKQIDHLGVILDHTHYKGLRFGPTLTDSEMDYLPIVEDAAAVAANTIYAQYEEPPIPFPGTWDTDSRLCLKASAPRPCTILAATMDAQVNA